jgi:K+-sensing histidine kinase KdpD
MQNDTIASKRAALLHTGAQVSKRVASILDIQELLPQIVDVICDEFNFYYAGVFLVDEAGKWAILRAGRGDAGAAMMAGGHRLEAGESSMIGASIVRQEALIALDVGEEPVHFRNPHLPNTRSEMALPLIVGDEVLGALTVQSTQEAAFSGDDIAALQSMADQLAIAINNARLLQELEATHADLLRAKTFEAIATSTIQAIHWIGNKALPISNSIGRLQDDLSELGGGDPDLVASMREDMAMIANNAALIVSVQEHLIGPAREEMPRPAMLDDVVKDTVVQLNIPSAIVSYAIASDLPLVRADTTQLNRALGYVLKNAMEAIEGADEQRIVIEVAPTKDGRFVDVYISDTGPGIPEEDLDKVWTTFYTTKGEGHAGLGLAACLQIVKQLDGQVSAANVADGGALVTLSLPVCSEPSQQVGLPSDRSILLIDDADAWSRFVEGALTSAGSSVIHPTGGMIDPGTFDLILLDNVLETISSAQMLKRLKSMSLAAKTIVVASSLRVEQTTQLMRFGVKDIVLKPYTKAALAQVMD